VDDHAIGTVGTFDRGIRHLTLLDHALLHPGLIQHRFSVSVVLDHLLKGLMIDHRGLSLCLAAVAVAPLVLKVVPQDHLVPLVLNRDDRAWQ